MAERLYLNKTYGLLYGGLFERW